MRAGRRTIALLLALLLSAGLLASAAHATAPDAEGRKTALRAVVKRALAECQVPGAAVGVWTPKGDWSLITGRADVASGRPVARDDRFAIRSITKSFVVTLILQLDADGRLSLDDPIARFVPGVPRGDKIKLRNLANMTSGVFNYTTDPSFLEALGRNPRRQWQPAELLGYALRHPLNFAPGTAYEYSKSNTLLLGEVVERVTGRSIAQVLQRRILDPLHLDSVRYLTGPNIPPPSARGYQGLDAHGRPDVVDLNATAFGAAGAMASTLDDLHRWGVALVNGRLLPPACSASALSPAP